MTTESDSGDGLSWVAGVGVVCAAMYVLVVLMRDVFSADGLLYSLGLGDGTGLMWPTATAVVTWGLFVECCAVGGVVANYSAGRWHDWWLKNLLLGHVTFLGWLFRALRWTAKRLYGGASWALDHAAREPGPLLVVETAEPDDFDGLVVDSEAL